MVWKLEYKQHTISGLNNCDACCVELNSADGFQWEILCPSVHSAKIRISRHLQQQRMAAIAAQYKLKEATK